MLKVDSTSGSSGAGSFFHWFSASSHGRSLMQTQELHRVSDVIVHSTERVPFIPKSFHTRSRLPSLTFHHLSDINKSEDWGKDCASDIDFVLLFNDADVSPTIFEELWQRTEVQLTGWTLPPGVPVSLSRGRFGLVASLSKDVQIEVDIIPALADPSGGHWIWDSVSKKVIHNNPKALADFMEQILELGLSKTFRCWFVLFLLVSCRLC